MKVIRASVLWSGDCKQDIRKFCSSIYQERISFIVFFCSIKFNLDLLAPEIEKAFGPDVCVLGCTSAGEISSDGYVKDSITGFSISGEGLYCKALLLQNSTDIASFTMGGQVHDLLTQVRCHADFVGDQHLFATLFVDGLSKMEEHVVSGVYSSLSGIPLFGGSAGDDGRLQETFVYYKGQFYRDSAVIALVHCVNSFVVFKTEHFITTDKKMVVTKADPASRIVYEIDGLPAAQRYFEIIGCDPSKGLNDTIFSENPVVVKIGGELFVRSISSVLDDGSLSFYCAVDEGLVLTLVKGEDIISNLSGALDTVTSKIGKPELIIGFDCILRQIELKNKSILTDAGQLLSRYNVVGFSTYGEQFNSMHINQTFTGVAIGKKRVA